MTVGTVKWFNRKRGFGFIEPEGGDKDAFVHISAVKRAGLAGLDEGQRLEYELVPLDDGRLMADQLKVLGQAGDTAAEAAEAGQTEKADAADDTDEADEPPCAPADGGPVQAA